MDLDSITLVAGLTVAGTALGIGSIALDFLDYHQQNVDERKWDYITQQREHPQTAPLEKPTWLNTIKYSYSDFISEYKEWIKHPLKNF
jgi:hypothetical protein